MADWACVRSKPGEHYRARSWLQYHDHEVYLPLVREHARVRPLFGPYLFVLLTEQWGGISTLPGVAGLLMDGEHPARLHMSVVKRRRGQIAHKTLDGDQVIARLRQQEGPDGVIMPPREERYAKEPYDRGQIVRVRDPWHPLHGHDLTFVGMRSSDRVLVMLSWFGRSQPVHLDSRLVQAATI